MNSRRIRFRCFTYLGFVGGGMKSWMLVVSLDLLVGSSSSLISASASESSVCVSSACSWFSCASQRFRFASSVFMMRVDKVLPENLSHSLNNGVTTYLMKPVTKNKQTTISWERFKHLDTSYQLVFWQRKWIVDRKWKSLEDSVFFRIPLVGRTRHTLLSSTCGIYPKVA